MGDTHTRQAAIGDGFEQDHLLDEGVPVAVGWRRSDGSLVPFNVLSASRAAAERWEVVYVYRATSDSTEQGANPEPLQRDIGPQDSP